VTPTVVFDLDKVLLNGNTTALLLGAHLRRHPRGLLRVLAASPVLVPSFLISVLRPLAELVVSRLTAGRDPAVLDGYRHAVARRPQAAVADALSCLREHVSRGDRVVVATASEESLARGFLAAVGYADVDVVGSTVHRWPPRVRRAKGEAKVAQLVERGFPPPWTAVYSDSASDLPLFAGTPRPVLVNAPERVVRTVARALGRRPETADWH
jgi:phosphatidylglycerophosphatase C